jgi:hypothetical protein
MGDENTFDAEMTSLMNGEIPSSPAPAQPQATQDTQLQATQSAQPSKSWKAGGREWTSPEDLAKSHDALWREFGKRNQDWTELKELREVRKNLQNDPELARHFRASLEAFQNARKPVTPATPNTMAQLPPEVMAEINRARDAANSIELERETQGLVRKYKLSDDDVRKVEDYSMANQGIPLEQAYKQMMFDVHQTRLAQVAQADAQKRKDASKAAAPVPGHYQPTPRGGPSMKSDADWRKLAGAELGKHFSDNES